MQDILRSREPHIMRFALHVYKSDTVNWKIRFFLKIFKKSH